MWIMLIKRLHAKHIVASLQLVCEIQVLRRDDCLTFFVQKKRSCWCWRFNISIKMMFTAFTPPQSNTFTCSCEAPTSQQQTCTCPFENVWSSLCVNVMDVSESLSLHCCLFYSFLPVTLSIHSQIWGGPSCVCVPITDQRGPGLMVAQRGFIHAHFFKRTFLFFLCF